MLIDNWETFWQKKKTEKGKKTLHNQYPVATNV